MILGQTIIQGLGVYRTRTTVDWSALGPGIIAVRGDNRAGKTTLLECSFPGWAYGEFPMRNDSFAGMVAPGVRDAQLSQTFTLAGRTYRALWQADPQYGGGRGKTEAYLSLVDGEQLTPLAGPGVKDYHAAIAALLPPARLAYASVYATQQSRFAPLSFFGLPPRERKDMVMAMLGAERWQAWSVRSGKEAEQLARELADVRRQLVEAERRAADVTDTQARLDAATQAVATAEGAMADAQAQVASHEQLQAQARAALQEAERELAAVQERNRAVVTRVRAAQVDRGRLQAELDQVDAVRAGADRIRGAIAQDAQLADALPGLRGRATDLQARVAPLVAARATADARLDALRADHERVKADLERTRARVAAEAVRRLELVNQLEEPANPLCRRCPLTKDALATTTGQEDVDRIDGELARVIAAGRDARVAAQAARTALDQAQGDLVAVDDAIGQAEGQRTRLAADVARAPGLATAEATRAALLPQLAAAEAAAAEAPLVEPDVGTWRVALNQADESLRVWRRAVDDGRAVHAGHVSTRDTLRGRLAALGDACTAATLLRGQEATLIATASDWRVLERDCGRDGVQAVELDQAGPSVSELANDLLATCYGGRFALDLQTQVEKDRGGVMEVFEARILTDDGREMRQGCGGEQTIIEEALRLGFGLDNARRSGYAFQTLWRDETGSALSPSHAQLYLAMLRRARERGHFHQVVLVSHTPAVWEGADVRLLVEDGQVVVE